MIEDRIPTTNTSKRLPIVFCLDVSPSMRWKSGNHSSSIELLNLALDNFITELKNDPKASTAAEIAFVTFSTDIEMDTDFRSISTLRKPDIQTVRTGGTYMAKAVLRSIQKIEDRRKELENSEIGYYAPFLVLVTDGNPDKNDDIERHNKALKQVRKHCDSHVGASEIIIPFIIGVGDHVDTETLNDYAKGFTNGFFPICGDAERIELNFKRVFQMIGNSTKKSIHLNGKAKEIIETFQEDMNDLLASLNRR